MVPLYQDAQLQNISIDKEMSELFVPADCWFVAYEHVGYRMVFKHNILCFSIHMHFRDTVNA
jgi:hypothetical protein